MHCIALHCIVRVGYCCVDAVSLLPCTYCFRYPFFFQFHYCFYLLFYTICITAFYNNKKIKIEEVYLTCLPSLVLVSPHYRSLFHSPINYACVFLNVFRFFFVLYHVLIQIVYFIFGGVGDAFVKLLVMAYPPWFLSFRLVQLLSPHSATKARSETWSDP